MMLSRTTTAGYVDCPYSGLQPSLEVDGGALEIPGEAFLPGLGSPDFLAYPFDIVQWGDGEKLMNETREQILHAFVEAANADGIVVEQEPYLPLGAG
jgi:hypothetical protein